MVKFRLNPELLAHILDLPTGTELGVIERIPIGNGHHVYQVAMTGPGWPEDGYIDLHYTTNADGSYSLTGFSTTP